MRNIAVEAATSHHFSCGVIQVLPQLRQHLAGEAIANLGQLGTIGPARAVHHADTAEGYLIQHCAEPVDDLLRCANDAKAVDEVAVDLSQMRCPDIAVERQLVVFADIPHHASISARDFV